MINRLVSAIGKKALLYFTTFVIVFSASVKVYASGRTADGVNPAYITYNGSKDNYLVFKVDYKNDLAKPFQLVIKNEQNEILYSKMFGANSLITNVLLTKVPDNSKLTFSIESGKNNFRQSFKIDTEVKTTEAYIVKGL